MRTVFLCCILLLAAGAPGSWGSILTVITATNWPSTGNCSLPDPTKPCDFIVTNLTLDTSDQTAAEKVKNTFIRIAAGMVIGVEKFSNHKSALCLAATSYRNCIAQTLTNCRGNRRATSAVTAKRKRVFLLSNYIKDEVCAKSNLDSKFKSFDFSTCFSGSVSLRQGAIILTYQYLNSLAGDRYSGTCRGAVRTVRKAIGSYPDSFSKQCKQKMTLLVNFIVRFFVRPDVSCKDASFKDEVKASDGGNPRDRRRKTVQLVSCNHYRALDATGFVTCADETQARNVTLFDSDFFNVQCELHPANDSGQPNTQCRAVSWCCCMGMCVMRVIARLNSRSCIANLDERKVPVVERKTCI